jgi:hypothetical protein
MQRSTAERLRPYRERVRRLAAQLAETGFLKGGTVIRHYARCGNPGCRCQRDPSQRHGPYYRWSTKVAGKTVSRHLSEEEGRLYSEWIADRRRVRKILDQIEQVSEKAAAIALEDAGRSRSTVAGSRS